MTFQSMSKALSYYVGQGLDPHDVLDKFEAGEFEVKALETTYNPDVPEFPRYVQQGRNEHGSPLWQYRPPGYVLGACADLMTTEEAWRHAGRLTGYEWHLVAVFEPSM